MGKTHLARALCRALPGALYAKQGCGPRKEGKGEHFFRTAGELAAFLRPELERRPHLVAESNALVREGRGDLVLFIEPVPGLTDPRPDVDRLREVAHLRIGSDQGEEGWRRVLAGRLGDQEAVAAVMPLLAAQQRYHLGRSLTLHCKFWFTRGDRYVFGPGLARILAAVEEQGTLRGAVAAVEISYRHAWNMIKEAERTLGRKLILPQVGGSGGGGSTLAPGGSELLRIYREVSAQVREEGSRIFAARLAAGRAGEDQR